MVVSLNFMPGTTKLSRNLAKIVNAQLSSSNLKKNQGVSASLGLTPGCRIWTLEFIMTECGAIEVPEELMNNGFFSKIILATLKPCDFVKDLPATDKDEAQMYFSCGTEMRRYKATIVLLRITELHPGSGITINKKQKIGEIIIKNF